MLDSERNPRRKVLAPALRGMTILLTAALFGLADARAQDSTPPDTGVKQITVDLSSGRVTGVLPFDQPFSFVGTTAKNLTRIAGEWCELTTTPEQSGKRERGGKKDREEERDVLLRKIHEEGDLEECPDSSSPKKLLYPHVGDAAGTTRTFSLYQNERLEPNRNFVFVFQIYRRLDDAALTSFKQQVRSALETEFREIDQQADEQELSLTVAQYSELLAEIDRILRAQPVQSGERLESETTPPTTTVDTSDSDPQQTADTSTPAPKSVSVFRAATLAAEDAAEARSAALLDQPWTIHFDDVYITQVQRRGVLTQLMGSEAAAKAIGTTDRLQRRLVELGRASTLATLHSAITDLPAEKRAGIDQLLTQPILDSIQALTVANRRRLARFAQGVESLPGGPTSVTPVTLPAEIWRAEDAAALVTNLNATAGALEDLADFTKTVQRLDFLAEALGESAGALTPLRGNLITPALNDVIEVRDDFTRLQRILDARSAALEALAEFLRREARINVPVVASSGGSFSTRARFHISSDLGLLYAGDAGLVRPYFGANFYTRPVNRDVPLSVLGGFKRRFSFLAGLTLSSVKETESGTEPRVLRDDLFASQTLALGVGYRLGDTTRLAVGALIYQQNDPNPLIDNLDLKADFFVSLSFDQSLRQLLGPIGNLFGNGSDG